MENERFSPVNEVSEFEVNPLVSPGRSVSDNQSEDGKINVEDIGLIPSETEQVEQENSEVDHAQEETSLVSPLSTPGRSTRSENTIEVKVKTTAQLQQENVLTEDFDELHTDRTLELLETKVADDLREFESCKPISLPKEGQSYLSTRNYLAEQGLVTRTKLPHEIKTYFVPNCANQNNLENKSPHHFATGNLSIRPTSKTPFTNSHVHNILPNKNVQSTVPNITVNGNYNNNSQMSSYIGRDVIASYNMTSHTQEKEELQRLNDRFSAYVQHMRQLSENNSKQDPSHLHIQRTTIALQEQMQNLRHLYENELENVRKQAEDLGRERNHLKVQSEKNLQTGLELQDRLVIESDKNRKMMDEMNVLQRRIGQLEQELTESQLMSQQPLGDILQLRRDLDNLTRENDTLKRRCEKEQILRQEAEDKLHQLETKIAFNVQVHESTVEELKGRLDVSTTNILSLETRVTELSQLDLDLPDLLQKVREASEEDFLRYKAESEEHFNRNMTAVRVQVEEDARRIDMLMREKHELIDSTGELHTQIRALQGKVKSLDHEKLSLEEVITSERQHYMDQLREMEGRMREMQDLLMSKIQEASLARETQIPIMAEIEALKLLLQEEENRLQTTLNGTPTEHSTMFSGFRGVKPSLSSPAFVALGRPQEHSSHSVQPSAPLDTTIGTSTAYSHTLNSHTQYRTMVSPQPQTTTTMTARYRYESTPSVNKLNLEKCPHTVAQSILGPISRAKSAPASGRRARSVTVAREQLGEGKDYFNEMFVELKPDKIQSHAHKRPHSSPMERPAVSSCHDYNTSTSSSTGDLKILEVNQDGKYVRLVNAGEQDCEIGGYMLKQNVGGHPVAVYRFNPRNKFHANSTITVWSGSNDPLLHQPPTDFVWKEQQKWGTGPECTTILCKPNGQAVAWTTAAHRFTPNAFDEESSRPTTEEPELTDVIKEQDNELTEVQWDLTGPRPDPVYLKREKQQPPSLVSPTHPHGSYPGKNTHPQTRPSRTLTYGNDNSSMNRQSRSQTSYPDPVQGPPYAGGSGPRVGSAPLRRFVPHPSPTIKGNGQIANQTDEVPGKTSMPPSAFMPPHNRFGVGLQQVRSQHHDYNPPMPRPPLFSAW